MGYLRGIKYVSFFLLAIGILCSSACMAQTEENDVRIFKKHEAPVKAIAISGDDKILATGGEDKMICLWDIASGKILNAFQCEAAIKALSFTPEGYILAACGSEIKLMDNKGKFLQLYMGYTTDIWSMSFNYATKRIVAGSYAKTIKIWDYQSAEVVLSLEGHERSCLPVCFNTEGDRIASGSLDKSVRLWDAKTGQQLNKFQIHSENIFAVAFHPSGKYIASASADKTIRLWDADSGKFVRTFIGHKGAVFDVQFSPDGNHMLSCDADKVIILWETATGKKLYVFAGHTGAVNSIRFTHDGTGFISCSEDQTVRYWPLEKKIFLAGTYYEQEIEKEVTGSPLFRPREEQETKQDYQLRVSKANSFLDELYSKYYIQYIDMLDKTPIK